MRDYTTTNYCNFLWINDLLQLKKNTNNVFTKEILENRRSRIIKINYVIVFGTIVEVKPITSRGFLYLIDDGTGVIACKHSQEQFEELISSVENGQINTLNETLEFHQNLEQSNLVDVSADDSVFNDRSIQMDEINVNKNSRLKGLQSIWDDLYASFSSLIQEYDVGDSVIIQGKLYNYYNVNQIYINSIRKLSISEEIMQLRIKLEGDPDESQKAGSTKILSGAEKRLSGLITFDNIQKLDPAFSKPGNITPPIMEDEDRNQLGIVTPNLQSSITFDTFQNKM